MLKLKTNAAGYILDKKSLEKRRFMEYKIESSFLSMNFSVNNFLINSYLFTKTNEIV